MLNKTAFFLILTLTLLGCKKEEFPEEIKGTSVFYLEGTVGGNSFRTEAGKEGYFMETFYEKDAAGIYTLGGALTSSAETGGSFTILIRQNEGAFSIDNTLRPESYDFRKPAVTDTSYRVQFNSVSMADSSSLSADFFWDFGDSITSKEENPVHIYANKSIEKYNVCLRVVYDSGCTSDLCTDVFMPVASCSASFTETRNTSTFLTYKASGEGSPPFKYDWDFITTDQHAVSQQVDYEYHTPPSKGVEKTCVTITDANNCVARYCRNVILNNTSCAANLDYSVETVTSLDSSAYQTIVIRYVDPHGRLYTSNDLRQQIDSEFGIISQKEYKNDRHGNKTRQLTFSAVCRLYSGQDAILLDIKKGVIAVAYP